MKVCKIKPDHNTCSVCIDIQMEYDRVEDCSKCPTSIYEYELLQIGTGFWSGDYAMVQRDGVIKKVSLSRVYGVREV